MAVSEGAIAQWTLVELVEMPTCRTCGVPFAVPRAKYEACMHNGETWYCHNGHSWHRVETREQRLQRELARERSHNQFLSRRAEHLEASRRAVRGHLTRTRRRIAAGVCPCCKRTFRDLASHMQTKHPGYAEGA